MSEPSPKFAVLEQPELFVWQVQNSFQKVC